MQGLVKIDKVYRAPSGREVEECTLLEISDILKDVEQQIKNIYTNNLNTENQLQTEPIPTFIIKSKPNKHN